MRNEPSYAWGLRAQPLAGHAKHWHAALSTRPYRIRQFPPRNWRLQRAVCQIKLPPQIMAEHALVLEWAALKQCGDVVS